MSNSLEAIGRVKARLAAMRNGMGQDAPPGQQLVPQPAPGILTPPTSEWVYYLKLAGILGAGAAALGGLWWVWQTHETHEEARMTRLREDQYGRGLID